MKTGQLKPAQVIYMRREVKKLKEIYIRMEDLIGVNIVTDDFEVWLQEVEKLLEGGKLEDFRPNTDTAVHPGI